MLALMLLVASSAALVAAVAPMTPQAPTRLLLALGCLGLALLVLTWWSCRRPWLHVGCLAVVLGTCVLIAAAATPAGAAGAAVSLLWVPIYAAFFFSRSAVRGYVAFVAVCFAGALALNTFQGAAHVWALVVLTTWAAAGAICSLVGRLHDQATRDPLTGLLNRQGLEQAAARALFDSGRSGRPLTVVAVDLNGFKLVNDRDGHAAGDRLLVELARSWRETLRCDEILARHGGDEFVLVLPGALRSDADEVMHRLSAASSASWCYGTASFPESTDLPSLLALADRDLYAAKAARAVAAVPTQRQPVDQQICLPREAAQV